MILSRNHCLWSTQEFFLARQRRISQIIYKLFLSCAWMTVPTRLTVTRIFGPKCKSRQTTHDHISAKPPNRHVDTSTTTPTPARSVCSHLTADNDRETTRCVFILIRNANCYLSSAHAQRRKVNKLCFKRCLQWPAGCTTRLTCYLVLWAQSTTEDYIMAEPPG